MDDLDQWPKKNAEFLSAAIEWLRLKLVVLAGDISPRAGDLSSPAASAVPSPSSALAPRRLLFAPAPTPEPVMGASPIVAATPPVGVTIGDLLAQEGVMNAAAAIDPPPALMILQRRFELNDFERHVLLLCVAVELNTSVAGLCARAQDDPARPYPTFALAYAMWPDAPWSALAPDGKLRHWRLVEINQPGSTPLMSAALRADEKIVNYVKGLNHLDDRLAPLVDTVVEPAGLLPPSHEALVDDIAAHLRVTPPGQRPPVYQLIGPDASSKQAVAAAVCEALRLQLVRLPLAVVPSQSGELEATARLWQRETLFVPRALYIEAHDLEGHLPVLQRFLSKTDGLVFCALRDHQPDLGRESLARDVAKPTALEQAREWRDALGEEAGDEPGRLASQFSLNVTAIRQIARQARLDPRPGDASLADRVWRACLAETRPRLDILAQRIEPKVQLADIVLPEEQMETLTLIADQIRNRALVYDEWGFRAQMSRGLGISALFAGESGTGKTMAAEALASELKLNLYRIDLSAVVNKYLGETEKNLRRLFDAAEDGGALLFFDEADALFGKRSEVKDSHDRYANIETNYLLQRLEAFGGLAILATNMKSALDAAFMRRLRFIVTFPFPGPKEREAIWRRVFPARTPVSADVDFERLSRAHLTGANIQSIAMHAAFLTAKAGEPTVTMARVLAAARSEFRKFDWPINEADFRAAAPAGART